MALRGDSGSGGKLMLSDRLKNMRFMRSHTEADQKTKQEKEQRQHEEASQWTIDTQSIQQKEHSSQPITNRPLIIVEDGYIDDDQQDDQSDDDATCVGRQSFGKFNPVIEKRNQKPQPQPQPQLHPQPQLATQHPIRTRPEKKNESAFDSPSTSFKIKKEEDQLISTSASSPTTAAAAATTTTSNQRFSSSSTSPASSRPGKRSYKHGPGPYNPSSKKRHRRNHSNLSKNR